MTRDVLFNMLTARAAGDEITQEEAVFTAQSGALSLLLSSGDGSPAPLARIKRLELLGDYVTAETEEAIYCLPYAGLAGIKVTAAVSPGRTGFHS